MSDGHLQQQTFSREEAAAAGLVHYFTGIPCEKGHVGFRYVSNKYCLACAGVNPRVRASKMSPLKDAIAKGETRYFGRPCCHGHIGLRRVRDCECVECDRLSRKSRSRPWSQKEKERKRRQNKRRRERNRALGLTAAGKPFKRIRAASPQSKEEKLERNRTRNAKARLALQALEELGIKIEL